MKHSSDGHWGSYSVSPYSEPDTEPKHLVYCRTPTHWMTPVLPILQASGSYIMIKHWKIIIAVSIIVNCLLMCKLCLMINLLLGNTKCTMIQVPVYLNFIDDQWLSNSVKKEGDLCWGYGILSNAPLDCMYTHTYTNRSLGISHAQTQAEPRANRNIFLHLNWNVLCLPSKLGSG